MPGLAGSHVASVVASVVWQSPSLWPAAAWCWLWGRWPHLITSGLSRAAFPMPSLWATSPGTSVVTGLYGPLTCPCPSRAGDS